MKRCLFLRSLCLPADIEGNQAQTCMFISILYITIPPRFTAAFFLYVTLAIMSTKQPTYGKMQ